MPGLNPDGLVGGASYYDAQVRYPERLVLENVRDAVDHGAVLETYARVTRVRVERGRATGVDWQSARGSGGARAPLVVNAAGPWVDEVLGPIQHTRLIGGTKGSHIVVPPFPSAPRVGVYVEAGADHRPFFILPWNELLLIGTTDERYEGDPGAADDRRARARVPRRRDRARVSRRRGARGPRALHAHGRAAAAVQAARRRGRDHAAPSHSPPSRRARACTRSSAASSRRIARSPRTCCTSCATSCRGRRGATLTRARPLPGALAAADRDSLLADLRESFGERQAQRLLRIYGKAAADVAALARRPELGERLGGSDVLTAELVHALTNEFAVTLVDLLQRRCMAGLDADFGLRAAPPAAAALTRLGIWDSARAAHELAAYHELAARHGARR